MNTLSQKEKAVHFRRLHAGPGILVLPNAWDAASARIFEQAGFPAVATTSSGVAAALGYPDGQHISREMLVNVVASITRVVTCPVSVDLEAGYGSALEETLLTVRAIIAAGAVGINLEDSTKGEGKTLVHTSQQADTLKAIQELARSLDVPLVINARTDVFLLPGTDSANPASRVKEAASRLDAYRQAGADCLFPIGVGDAATIAALVHRVKGPLNILAGPATPSIAELAQLGVARASFGSGLMRAALGRLRSIAQALLARGTFSNMDEMLSGAELQSLVAADGA